MLNISTTLLVLPLHGDPFATIPLPPPIPSICYRDGININVNFSKGGREMGELNGGLDVGWLQALGLVFVCS